MILEFLLSTVLQGQVSNELGCIGIECKKSIYSSSNPDPITKVLKDSPADRAGILKKDMIISITNENTGEFDSAQGPIGESLVLKVKRRECMYTYKPYKSCEYCFGKHDIDVVKTFIVKREPCVRSN